jgi:hypothetical protein
LKAFLLYPDGDLETKAHIPWNAQALTEDLALKTLFEAMAEGDSFLFELPTVILSSIPKQFQPSRIAGIFSKIVWKIPSFDSRKCTRSLRKRSKKKGRSIGIFSRYLLCYSGSSIEVMHLYVDLIDPPEKKLQR